MGAIVRGILFSVVLYCAAGESPVQAAPLAPNMERASSASLYVYADDLIVADCCRLDRLSPDLGLSELADLPYPGNPSVLAENEVRDLPGVPAAVFMALFGFACISAVKDRKFYVAAFAGLLCVCQASINVLPKMARLHRGRDVNRYSADSIYTRQVLNSFRPRCEIEGNDYAGLLHKLAGIPDSITDPFKSAKQEGVAQSTESHTASLYSSDLSYHPSLSAILESFYYARLSFDFATAGMRRLHYVDPAFFLNLLPHGPPANLPNFSC